MTIRIAHASPVARGTGWFSKEWTLSGDGHILQFDPATGLHAGGWFSGGYGAFRRLSGASGGDGVDPRSRAARHVTLFREDAALTDCEAWLTSLYGQSIDPENPDRDEAATSSPGPAPRSTGCCPPRCSWSS
jgi:hypothetical protein